MKFGIAAGLLAGFLASGPARAQKTVLRVSLNNDLRRRSTIP